MKDFILAHYDTMANLPEEQFVNAVRNHCDVINEPVLIRTDNIESMFNHTVMLKSGNSIIVVETAEEIYKQLKK